MAESQRVPPARKMIDRYGGGGFHIGGEGFKSSVLVASTIACTWPAKGPEELTVESLAPLFAAGAVFDLLLLGCGPRLRMPSAGLRTALRSRGIALEPMDTGAACRTFNLLTSEERRVAAALIAV